MAGRLTLWGAGELLRTFFGRTSEAPPAFYLALIKDVAPTPYVSGAELDEPVATTGYQRVELPNDPATWNEDSGLLHVVANEIEAVFVTAVENWGRIGYWAVCNAPVDGYVYFVGEMEQSQIIDAGDQAVLGAGELVVELGPFFTDQDY